MAKRLKIVLIIFSGLVVLTFIGIVIANNIITSKIENFLSNSLPESIVITYDAIEVSAFSGNLTLLNSKVSKFGETANDLNAEIVIDNLSVEGFGYWDYIVHKVIRIEKISISKPQITYYHNEAANAKHYQDSKLEDFKSKIKIEAVHVEDGEILIKDVETDSILLKTDNIAFNIAGITMDEKTAKRSVPFIYEDYDVQFDRFFYQLGAYENLEIASSKMTKKGWGFDQVKVYTKYSKHELTNMISKERDHFNININSIDLKNQEFGFTQDSIFYFRCPKIVINKPVMEIYRNKLVPDDTNVKLLYSNILRRLKTRLTLSEVLLNDASIIYLEKENAQSSAGKISFSQLNANIKNLSNTYEPGDKTSIDIDAIFMKSTPMRINWNFDVNNVNDQFVYKGEIGRLPAHDLNSFTEPNLKVKFKGELIKTYFTIDGNAHNSNIDLKTDYDNFEVVILEKDGKEKNKFLSAMANLFIKKSTRNTSDDFREGYKTNIERDKTKSIFNFVWLNAKAGLISAMTGNGKK